MSWLAVCVQIMLCAAFTGAALAQTQTQAAEPAAAPAQPQAPIAPTPDNYVINIGDEIALDILDDSEPPQIFAVGRDGQVQLPFIGGLEVAGSSVGAARELVRATYVDNEIFLHPRVELSIAGFRQIAVLGDVRNPGNFDFQPFLTAEQAVGMAGGPAISTNNEEARVLERRSLEAALTNLEYDLALSATRYARTQAQLAGSDALAWTDVPQDLRASINQDLFDEHKVQEDQIIALERKDADTRRGLLEDAVAEAQTRIGLLDQRAEVLGAVLAAAREELGRIRDIVEKGLAPRSNLVAAERTVATSEGDLLALKEQKSGALVQLADLRGQLSRFDSEREQQFRTAAQEFLSAMKRSIADREASQDRVSLLEQWMNAAAGMQTDLLVRYQARRRKAGGIETVVLLPYDELLPGDLLVVTVVPPEEIGGTE